MIKAIGNRGLAYLGIPIVGALLIIMCADRIESFTMLRYEVLIVFAYITALCDLKTRTIPNSLILIMLIAWVLIMVPKIIIDTDAAVPILKDSLYGLFIAGGMFILVYIISRKGLGGGDVKFMAASGLYLGLGGIFTATFCGTVLAGLAGLALILLKKIGRKDAIPLAPFLYAGILITVFFT